MDRRRLACPKKVLFFEFLLQKKRFETGPFAPPRISEPSSYFVLPGNHPKDGLQKGPHKLCCDYLQHSTISHPTSQQTRAVRLRLPPTPFPPKKKTQLGVFLQNLRAGGWPGGVSQVLNFSTAPPLKKGGTKFCTLYQGFCSRPCQCCPLPHVQGCHRSTGQAGLRVSGEA